MEVVLRATYERWVALGQNPVSATSLKNSEEIELSRQKIEILYIASDRTSGSM
jgi:hypothetical protein